MPILIIDFDSTFVSVEALDELARIALRDVPDRDERLKKIEAITRAGMEGKIGFGESLSTRLDLFRVRQEHLSELIEFLKTRVTPSVRENRAFFEENAERIYILSGGFREYIMPVVREFGIAADHVIGNTFVWNSTGEVAGCDETNLMAGDGGKVKRLHKLALDGQVVMVGDGYSDFQTRLHGAADAFVAFVENADRPVVSLRADYVAKSFSDVIRVVKTGIVSKRKISRV